ncbi:MAG: AI-2E family transporter [Chloroflexi bacterium]|nr:AI-2E family transporter [Chloroflexota bacterium]
MERNPWLRSLLVLLTAIAALYILGLAWSMVMTFSDIIMLFFLAWLLAFVLKPLARFLWLRLGIPRGLAVGTVYLGLLLILFLVGIIVVPIIAFQLAQVAANIPEWSQSLPSVINPLQQELTARGVEVNLSAFYQSQELARQVERIGTLVVQNAFGLATGVASFVFATLIVMILSFYIMLDGDRIAEEFTQMVPEKYQDETRYLLESIDRTFGGFLRGQLAQAVIYAAGTSMIMSAAGLPYILLASSLSGIVMIIPFFGPFLALVPPLLIAAFQSSPGTIVLVLVALLVLQQIVLNVLAPKIMSESMGMHPILVFLAILLGAKVAGLAGAIFGVPIVGVVNAMLLFLYRRSAGYQRRLEASEAPDLDSRALELKHSSWRRSILHLRDRVRAAVGKVNLGRD